MTDISADQTFARSGGEPMGSAHRVLLAALLGTLVFALIQFATHTPDGFPSNDDLLRFVHVQDLLIGQGWYDPVQYRLGLEGGTVMHWSKLIDAPIALLVLVGGESFAAFTWPALLVCAALAGLVLGAVRLGGDATIMPVTVIGVAALWSIGAFSIGSFDHHNVQAVLLVWAVVLLLPSSTARRDHALAGLACALMLTIGMETLPYVAIIGLWIAVGFVVQSGTGEKARAFGVGLAASAFLLFPALLAPWQWTSRACDAFSSFHLSLAVCGGLGLAIATMAPKRSAQLTLLGLAGAVGATIIVGIYPHCLANPLADLPPLMREFWLEGVVETRSAFDILQSDPFSLIAFFGMPVVALVWCATMITGRKIPVVSTLIALLLTMAIAVTIWQQRAFMFAAVIAVIPMSLAVTRARLSYLANQRPYGLALMALAWIASINVTWFIASAQFAGAFSSAPTLQEQIANAEPRDFCYDPTLFAALADEKDAVILSSTNVGPMILAHTPHRAIAGPYHRNVAGNVAMIKTMIGDPADAQKSLAKYGVTHIADCVADPDVRDFTDAAPAGFQAELHRDPTQFEWLELIPETAEEPLRIFRVVKLHRDSKVLAA